MVKPNTAKKRLVTSFNNLTPELQEPEELVGKTLLAITNLPPRKMMGIESCGMLMSAIHNEDGVEKLNLVMLNDAIPAGAKLC